MTENYYKFGGEGDSLGLIMIHQNFAVYYVKINIMYIMTLLHW